MRKKAAPPTRKRGTKGFLSRSYRWLVGIWEARKVVEFVDWRAQIPGFTLEEVKEKSQLIQDKFWDWEPDSHDSDYGDSDFIGFEDEQIEESVWDEFLVIN